MFLTMAFCISDVLLKNLISLRGSCNPYYFPPFLLSNIYYTQNELIVKYKLKTFILVNYIYKYNTKHIKKSIYICA